jgi:hypothetical protein
MNEDNEEKPKIIKREIQLTGFGNIGDGPLAFCVLAAIILLIGEPNLLDCIKYWLTNGAFPLPVK